MDESPHGDSDGGPGATDADVEAAVAGFVFLSVRR